MTTTFWPEFVIFFAAALAGSAAVLPYSLRLIKDKPLKFSVPVLLLLSMLQNAVLSAIVVVLGIFAAHAIGLGAPYVEAVIKSTPIPSFTGLEVGIVLGALAGALLLVADLFFVPYWPRPLLETAKQTTLLENFLASFYGGINEELLMRFFGFSALVWLLSFVWQPSTVIFWVINVIMAIVFGIGHLPALKGVVGTVSRVMLLRTILLNAPVGLVCGWLFWAHGIEAAIVAHFFADIIYHVVGTVVLRRRFS